MRLKTSKEIGMEKAFNLHTRKTNAAEKEWFELKFKIETVKAGFWVEDKIFNASLPPYNPYDESTWPRMTKVF